MKPQINLKPIGYVRTERSDSEVSQSWPKGVPGRITLFPEYSAGLRGLEGFSHLIIVAWLHKVSEENRNVLKVRFRRFTRLGMRLEDLPEVGVFASNSPHRPNPIAISIVKVRKIDGDSVYVEGLDLYDGTPNSRSKSIHSILLNPRLHDPKLVPTVNRKTTKRTRLSSEK